jgi:micrococcal nuclease
LVGVREVTEKVLVIPTKAPRGKRFFAVLAFVFGAWSLLLHQVAAETLTGKVVVIADGDTLTLLVDREQIRIRLEGIDAPETGQPFSKRAGEELGRLVFGQVVRIETPGKDVHGRTLGRVFVDVDGETIDVNAHLVREGFAWWFRRYSDDSTLKEAEEAARRERRGLWADPSPVAPWDWRAQQRARQRAKAGNRQTTEPAGNYWLNTATGVRHNSRCSNYGTTKRGRPCGRDEGRPCSICGG